MTVSDIISTIGNAWKSVITFPDVDIDVDVLLTSIRTSVAVRFIICHSSPWQLRSARSMSP